MSAKEWDDLHIDTELDDSIDDSTNTQVVDAQMQRILESFSQMPQPEEGESVRDHLRKLDALLEAPKEEILETRATQIKECLGLPEAYQALRQARWPTGVQCTDCHSSHVRRLPQSPLASEHNHRYRCLDCRLEFNDDEGIAGGDSEGTSSLSVWMQCWYLMGCTDSLSYIAHCLGLDLHHVEWMVQRLKSLLGHYATPKTNLEIETAEAQSETLGERLKAALLSHDEILDANIATVPTDTGEYRRQQHLRRHLSASTEPVTPNVNVSPKRKS